MAFIFLYASNLNALEVCYELSPLFYSTLPAYASIAL